MTTPKWAAWVALDPGDKHTGWAWGATLGMPLVEKLPEFITSGTWDSDEAVAHLDGLLGRLKWQGYTIGLIREEFRLFPHEVANQVRSRMDTPRLIGKIDLLCEQKRIPVKTDQDSSILKLMRRQLKARGIKLRGDTIHAECAELHLYYALLRRKEE